MKLHRLIVLNPHFTLELSASISAMLVYVSGFGRFRFVLAYAAFLIARAIFADCNTTLKEIIVVPIVILAWIFDVKYGAFYPVYGLNNILLAGILLVVFEATVRKVFQNKIDSIKSSDHFITCQNCSYMHSELVTGCQKCGYKDPEFAPKNNEAILINQIINTKIEEGQDDNQIILYQMPLPRTVAFYKNGIRKLRNHLFMAKDCVAIVEICGGNAWREGDVIPYDEITAITGEMKKSFVSKSPFLSIRCSDGSIFEIVLSSFDEYRQRIMQIQSVAKKINQEILVEINLPEPEKPAGQSPVRWS